jgi:hypothetical protein
MTTAIQATDPRVNLPGGIEWPEPIQRELTNFVRLDADRWRAVATLSDAQRAFHAAEQHDAAELADLLADGEALPAKRRRRSETAQQVMDTAKLDVAAYNNAVRISWSRLVGLLAEHREELRAAFAERQREAASRYAAAAAELDAAGRELTAFGGLLGMIDNADGTPVIRPWTPSTVVTTASSAVAEALPVVRADVAVIAAEAVEVEPVEDSEPVEDVEDSDADMVDA